MLDMSGCEFKSHSRYGVAALRERTTSLDRVAFVRGRGRLKSTLLYKKFSHNPDWRVPTPDVRPAGLNAERLKNLTEFSLFRS